MLTIFYFEEAESLSTTSRKPIHLEARKLISTFKPVKELLQNSEARRSDIMKNRKSKLAEKGLIVKQVQSRKLQLEKDNVTAKQSKLNSELCSASLNRQSFLHDREKWCGHLVLRAKNIAKNHYRRQAEQNACKKAKLEQLTNFATQRRERLLKTPRSKLLTLSKEDLASFTYSKEEACVCLQQWWRRYKFSPLIGEFLKLQLTIKTAKAMSFDVLVKLIQEKESIKTTSLMFHAIRNTAFSKSGSFWKTPTRTFLSAYMIATHPRETMPNKVSSEKSLFIVANDMLITFENWLDGYTCSNAHTLFSNFTESLNIYFQAFQDWKTEDTRELSDGMIAHWINLEGLWLSVRHQPDVEEHWRPSIEEQQKVIMSKLRKLGNGALERLGAARRAMEVESEMESQVLSKADVILTSPIRFPVPSRTSIISEDSVSLTIKTTEMTLIDNPKMMNEMTNVEQLMKTLVQGMSRQQLAHELIMNPDFELKPKVLSELEDRVKLMAKKTFYDAMRADFAKQEYLRYCPGLIEEVKTNLFSMVVDSVILTNEIIEHLDTQLVLQQIKHGVFDLPNKISFIIQKMKQLCAPFRDEAIKELSNQTDVVILFEMMMDLFELMKYDMMNYRLNSIKPLLKTQAIAYEREKFALSIQENGIILVKTEAWLSKHIAELGSIASSRGPDTYDIQTPKFEQIYDSAIISLIFGGIQITSQTCPETLELDAQRIHDFQNEVQVLCVVSVLAMLLGNSFLRFKRNSIQNLKMKTGLIELLRKEGTGIDQMLLFLVECVSECQDDDTADVVKESDMIKGMIIKTISMKDPVYLLLNRRLVSVIKSHLSTGLFKRDTLNNSGLLIIGHELEKMSKKIVLLATHNKQVYGEWYDVILKRQVLKV